MIFNMQNNEPCLLFWQPFDYQHAKYLLAGHYNHGMDICDWGIKPGAKSLILIALVQICFTNILFCGICCHKLRILLSNDTVFNSPINADIHWKFKSLIIKNCILSIAGGISTFVCYFLWLLLDVGVVTNLLYFDSFFNCLVIVLMFEYNERWYKYLCIICIKCCFLQCDKSYDKNNKNERNLQKLRLQKYLKQNYKNEKTKSNEKSSTHWTVETTKDILDEDVDDDHNHIDDKGMIKSMNTNTADDHDHEDNGENTIRHHRHITITQMPAANTLNYHRTITQYNENEPVDNPIEHQITITQTQLPHISTDHILEHHVTGTITRTQSQIVENNPDTGTLNSPFTACTPPENTTGGVGVGIIEYVDTPIYKPIEGGYKQNLSLRNVNNISNMSMTDIMLQMRSMDKTVSADSRS